MAALAQQDHVPSRVGADMIKIIRTLVSKAQMDDDAYRLFLRQWNVVSTKELTVSQGRVVIDRLKVMAGQADPAKGAVAGLDSPVAGKMRALWIAAWNLGLIRDRTDQAMLTFLRRQTGVSHTRFLKHPSEASAAIEALKSWLSRSGVVWPLKSEDVIEAKRAVLDAQWQRLLDAGVDPSVTLDMFAFKVTSRLGWSNFESCHYDTVQAALGRWLRDAMARQQGAAS